MLANSQGDYESAEARWLESLALARELGETLTIATALSNLGMLYEAKEEYQQATEHYEESLALSRDLGDKRQVTKSLIHLAEIAQLQGDTLRAAALHEKSLSLRVEINYQNGIAYGLAGIANLLSEKGYAETSVELFAASRALCKRIQQELNQAVTEQVDNWLAKHQESLGENQFKSKWSAGLKLNTDQAVTLAITNLNTLKHDT